MHNRYRHGRYEAHFEPSFHLSILGVCHTIFKEALSVFYGDNLFWFECIPLGPPRLNFKIAHSRTAYKGLKLQRKLVVGWVKSLRWMTPNILHGRLGCDAAPNYGRGMIQHIGLVMAYNDIYLDRFGRVSSSAISLAAVLRDFAVSGLALKTARLDLRFDNYCGPDDFSADSNIMKAAIALVVRERIVISASGYVDEFVGPFVSALAMRKAWKVAYTKNSLHPDSHIQEDIDGDTSTTEMVDEDSFEESTSYVHTWHLFPA